MHHRPYESFGLDETRLQSARAARVTKTLQGVEVVNAIYGRRAIRRYTAEPIARESLEDLVHVALQAPSSMDEEPWAFAVVTGAARLKAYSDQIKAHLLAIESRLPDVTHPYGDNIFHGAPALVVVYATQRVEQAAEDCCLAAQNLMLAAFSNGLGTCPIGLARSWLALPETKHELGIPPEWTPVFPVVVGFPDEEPENHGRRSPQIAWKDG